MGDVAKNCLLRDLLCALGEFTIYRHCQHAISDIRL
jgi:hypothetical protein